MAGTNEGKLSAEYVYSYWKSIGLDNVDIIDYDVLLDFPDDNLYNKYVLIILTREYFLIN